MDIPLNAKVRCSDGLCGHTTEVILHPETGEVTHVVVREKHSPHVERLVPVHFVTEETTEHQVCLRCSADTLAGMQAFTRTEVLPERVSHYEGSGYLAAELVPARVVESKWVTVRHKELPKGEVAVRRGAHVEATDGRVGSVDAFLAEPKTERITHLLLRRGHLWGERDVAIPISHIERFSEDVIYLRIGKQAVKELPAIPHSADHPPLGGR
jgi:sporulation protein YlmC with PRC-barrel domain